ncbi:MAG: hypothetical protein RW306_04985 [Geobacteraceae bacterium]|nr:hypothetical protein [Geobacteraceae bacterium]
MGIGFQIFKKTAGIFIGFAAIAILIVFGLFWWSVETMCANKEVSSTPIPSTKYKVVVFARDCGATTGFSTQASIIKSTAKLKNDNGNIFTADCGHGAAPAGPGGGPELRVKIIGPSAIELAHHPSAQIFDAQTNYEGISIKYSSFENR